MKMKTKAVLIVMVALIGIGIFAPIVSAETAEEWNNKAIGFVISGEYEKAIECFDKVIELDPNSTYAYNNRGIAYSDLKQYERAIEDYNKTIELDPNSASAYYNRGNTYCDLKKYEREITTKQ
jgi:tetratricopeptide (TPR) repeat protein